MYKAANNHFNKEHYLIIDYLQHNHESNDDIDQFPLQVLTRSLGQCQNSMGSMRSADQSKPY